MPSDDKVIAEIAALYGERKKRAKEIAAIDLRIELLLYPQRQTKRKARPKSGQEWERILKDERVTTEGQAMAG
ncbi:hypothetical protein [uncultured Desulfovibrio sp.]|uniref:hypothetical protein n=1 Tax=uncultured Desulfovibrio sp. TaxID=167968 RepID=UPI0026DBAA32|nr:hypothetical protein [uncultured Desulfovibrio sp.]